MEYLKKILKHFQRPEVNDAFFGQIYYNKPSRAAKYSTRKFGSWEAKRIFSPTKGEIELFIEASGYEMEPNETQRRFFNHVEKDYSKILASIKPVLKGKFEQWTRKPLTQDFEREFTLVSFQIPLDPNTEWEMSFESDTDGHLFTVCLTGDEPKSISIDG